MHVTYPIFIGTLTTMFLAFVGALWAVYYAMAKRLDRRSDSLEKKIDANSEKFEGRLYQRLESSAERKKQQAVTEYRVDLLMGKEQIPVTISRPPMPAQQPQHFPDFQEVVPEQIVSSKNIVPIRPGIVVTPPPIPGQQTQQSLQSQGPDGNEYLNFFKRERLLQNPQED